MSRRKLRRVTRRAHLTVTCSGIVLLLAAACGGTGSEPGTEVGAGEISGAGQAAATTEPQGSEAPGSDSSAQPTPGSDSGSAAVTEVSTAVPDLELLDVATGDPVKLRSLFPASASLLFWFWAPH